jgi:AcrR family transcriptional regulator
MATKTKNAVVDSFLSLNQKVNYDKITVSNLVEECKISRQTFYYHFDSISQMIEWALNNETANICKRAQSYPRWIDAAHGYVAFFNKYDKFFEDAIFSDNCGFVLDLLYNSFYQFLKTYLTKWQIMSEPINNRSEYYLKCASAAFVGLVIRMYQENDHDVDTLLQKINVTIIQNIIKE